MKSCLAMLVTLLFLLPAPAVVMAQAQQDQKQSQYQDQSGDQDACMGDAQTLCGQFIPDRERVAHCLMANRSRVKPRCREALKHFK
jgi:hypothetical protein